MDSFKSGNGVLTIADTIGLVAAAIYFYKQNVEMKGEIEALKRQLLDLRLKQDRSDKDTKREFKHLRKELTSSGLPAQQTEMQVEDMTLGACLQPALAGRNKPGPVQKPAPRAKPAPVVPAPVAKSTKARPVPPAEVDLDALSSDL